MIRFESVEFSWLKNGRSSTKDGDHSVFQGSFVDFHISSGGVCLLRGPSGSGKSTLLGLVAGLLTARAGRIEVAGQTLADLKPAERDRWRGRTVGFLPQRLHLDPALDVVGNLQLAGFAAGVPLPAARALEVLGQLGVAGLARRKPQTLSVGQAQRVALARAVVLRPKVLLADEPTASLDDAAAADAVALLLGAAQANQATLVIATHDARVVEAVAAARPDATTVTLRAAQPHPSERGAGVAVVGIGP